MFLSIINKSKHVFYIKQNLLNVVCIILIASVICAASITILMYHYMFYLREKVPYWEIAIAVSLVGVLIHFSLVAMKGLTQGVASN